MSFNEKIGPWAVHAAEIVYDNPWIRVVDHKITHPNGAPGQYGVVRYKNRAIGVLAIDRDGMVPLVGQHRFPGDVYSWELPEGGGPLDEEPLRAAERELREETGYGAGEWFEFARFDLSNSVSDETAVCYAAWDLVEGKASPEPSEALAHDRISFSALHERVLNGQISDSMTIVMVLKASAMASAGKLPAAFADLMRRGA